MLKQNFSERCYKLLRKVPNGKVITYKAVAEKLGTKAYRAVGNAMRLNKNPINVPCYRVVNSNGSLGGYSLGLRKKILFLKKEGIEIKNNKIDLKKFGGGFD